MNNDTVEWTDVSYGHRRAMATCRQTGAQVVGQWRLGSVPDSDRKAARDALAILTGRAVAVEWREGTFGEGGGFVAEVGDLRVGVRPFVESGNFWWNVVRGCRTLQHGYCDTEAEAKRIAEAVAVVLTGQANVCAGARDSSCGGAPCVGGGEVEQVRAVQDELVAVLRVDPIS